MLKGQEKKNSVSMKNITLTRLDMGGNAIVVDVPEYPLLNSLGLRPGKAIQACGRQFFGGPIMIKAGERQVAVGKNIAEKIIVKVV
jgi:ferrous iron transport protein A